jgi:hypothetical protein
VTLIARVLQLGGAESMSTSESGDVSPDHARVFDMSEDMATEDLSEIIAASLGVRHEARSRALVGSDATESESVAQGERHRLLFKESISAVEASMSANHGRLSREDNEIRERHIVAPLSVDILNSSVSEAAGKAAIIRVSKVDAAIRTSCCGVSTHTEVHKIVAGKSDEACGIFTHIIVLVKLFNNVDNDVLVVLDGHVGRLVDGAGGTRQDVRGISSRRLQLSVVRLNLVHFTIGVLLEVETEWAFSGDSSH